MKEINFISCGLTGDFIHTLYVIKNICKKEDAVANVYLSDASHIYGGEPFRFGAIKTYSDLYTLIVIQPFINKFEMLPDSFTDSFINLNDWRSGLTLTKSWSELLSDCYSFDISKDPKGIDLMMPIEEALKDKVIIHRSHNRNNNLFPYKTILDSISNEIIFLTSFESEWEAFEYKNDRMSLRVVSNIEEMAICINSCKYFIGNQSLPFALASSLDVPRLVELNPADAIFYMGETRYSNNISWFLDDTHKNISDNSFIKF